MPIRKNHGPKKDDLERPYIEIGERLKKWRMDNKLRQADIGGKFTNMAIMWYESGRRLPTTEFLLHLKEKFGVSADWILTGEEG